jgi:predicted ATPase
MIYVKSALFTQDHRGFKELDKIFFKDINIIVGDQGCGKSTLLSAMHKFNPQNPYPLTLELTEKTIKEGVDTFYFDFEKGNPRINDPIMYTTPSGKDTGIGFQNALKSRYFSHGEISMQYSLKLAEQKNAVILFDEPESGLSLRSQYKLVDAINKAASQDCQIFIATHSLVLIESFENVLSLEHRKWMNSEDFINSQKK